MADAPSSYQLSAELRDELRYALRRVVTAPDLPHDFTAAIEAALSTYLQRCRDFERFAGDKRKLSDWRQRRHSVAVEHHLSGYMRARLVGGNPHGANLPALRAFIFDALSALNEQHPFNYFGRKGPGADVLAAVLREADRLDGRPVRQRDGFSSRQWREWWDAYDEGM